MLFCGCLRKNITTYISVTSFESSRQTKWPYQGLPGMLELFSTHPLLLPSPHVHRPLGPRNSPAPPPRSYYRRYHLLEPSPLDEH